MFVHILFGRMHKFQFFFYANVLNKWLTISSLSSNNLHLLFCCGLSISVDILLRIIIIPSKFFAPVLADSLLLNLNDGKSSQDSRTLLTIPANLCNAVVWMVSARPPISNSSNLFTKSLGTVPSAPITIGITVTIIFHSYFSGLTRSKYLTHISFFFFLLCGLPRRQSSLFGLVFLYSVFLFIYFISFFVSYHKVWSSGQD